MAQSGHASRVARCPLSGAKRTLLGERVKSAPDQSGHERAAFAAMHAPDVLYVVRDRWLSGKPMTRREFQTRDAEINLARFIGELSN